MTESSDHIIDRRRLRRKLGFWRLAAVFLFLLLVVAVVGRVASPLSVDHVAVLHVDSTIYEDPRWDEIVADIAERDSSKALVLLINSGGGTALGSEKLYLGIRKVAEEKPVAAVIGTLGASGAYITAIAADHIVAHETSLTGSIGVVLQSVEYSELLEKIGVDFTNIKSGPFKAEPSETEPMDEDVRDYMQALILDTHQWFKRLVGERREMSEDEVEAVADGRIFTGRQAQQLGLVDAVGGEEDAYAWLRDERGIDESLPRIDRTPREELGPLDQLLSSFAGKVLSSERLKLDGLLTLWHP